MYAALSVFRLQGHRIQGVRGTMIFEMSMSVPKRPHTKDELGCEWKR